MKIINLIALFVAFALSVFGQNNTNENALFWEVSGNGLKKPSYIFGTYHFIGKSFVDTMKVVSSKLNKADAVVGELVMDNTEIMKLATFMMLKDTTLDKILNAEEYAKVDAVMQAKAKTPLKAFDTFKPMAVQVLLLPHFSPTGFNMKNVVIDIYFQNQAKQQKKPLYGLETAEEQAKILFNNSLDKQKESLVKFVSDTAKAKQIGEELYRAYINQDAAAMTKLFEEFDEYTQTEMDVLLKDRNQKWIEKLPAMMQKQSLFIAVGAGHLYGKDGIIKGLQAKGYKVKPMKVN